MTTTELILGRTVSNDAFAPELAARIRKESAAVGRSLQGSMAAQWNAAASEMFATYVETLARDHQRLVAISLVSTHYGNTDTYIPGPAARMFLASIGATGYRPAQPSDLLDELVVAAVEDARALREQAAQSLAAKDEQARTLGLQLGEAHAALALALDENAVQREQLGDSAARERSLVEETHTSGAIIDNLTDAKQRAERELAELKPKAERWREQLREERPLLRQRNTEKRELEERVVELEEELRACTEGQA